MIDVVCVKIISRVLVTGGAGFIGSHLIPRLLGRCYSVVVFDDLSTGKLQNLCKVSGNRDLVFAQGDIRDKVAVADALCGIDAVIHLAAIVGVPISVAEPVLTHDINTTGTMNVLQEASKQGVRRFVFASSAAVYGEGNRLPLKEDSTLRSLSPYAASKVAGESLCRAYAECYGLSTASLRFFNIYGPGSERSSYTGVIAKFLSDIHRGNVLTVFGNGEQSRDFVYVEDAVDAIIQALETKRLKGDAFNVCSGKPTSINELVKILNKVTGKKANTEHAPERKGEIRHSYGDPSKSERAIGFKTSTSIENGLERFSKALE